MICMMVLQRIATVTPCEKYRQWTMAAHPRCTRRMHPAMLLRPAATACVGDMPGRCRVGVGVRSVAAAMPERLLMRLLRVTPGDSSSRITIACLMRSAAARCRALWRCTCS